MTTPTALSSAGGIASWESVDRGTLRPTDLTPASQRLAMLREKADHWLGFKHRPASPRWVRVDSYEEHSRYVSALRAESSRRRALEAGLTTASKEFHVLARCWICAQPRQLHVDYAYSFPVDGIETPNWREHLKCPGCHLNNRMRAAIHFFESVLAPGRGESAVYITEQCTPMFSALSRRHPGLIGSEYLGDRVPLGESTPEGLRNESVTQLTFPSSSFDFILSFDVLEHVGRIGRALSECRRVLRPGGTLLFTVPFYPERRENLVRAAEDDDGSITHLLPPEYHGDPLSTDGCLAFHHFGWQLLDAAREAGFERVEAALFWSRSYGYLGSHNTLFVARSGAE